MVPFGLRPVPASAHAPALPHFQRVPRAAEEPLPSSEPEAGFVHGRVSVLFFVSFLGAGFLFCTGVPLGRGPGPGFGGLLLKGLLDG